MAKKKDWTAEFRRAATALSAAAILVAAAGCNSKTAATPANFTETLNAFYLEHPDCLFVDAPRFPYETHDPAMTKQMDALVSVDLLTAEREPAIHASSYTPTAAGGRAQPRFCYGHRVIASIDRSTPPAVADGFEETRVAYHYTMKDIPAWADTPQMKAAFPAMAAAISGNATASATLAKTMSGWQVPD